MCIIAITNGYCTLAEFKDYLLRRRSYVAPTISFAQSTSTIADSFKRLGRFVGASLIQIAGSVAGNNGIWEVASVSNSAIVITGTLTNANAGASITITDVSNPEDDSLLEQSIEAASRAIDTHCSEMGGNRRFWSNGTDEDRIYTPEYFDCFYAPDEIVSITTLATDENGDGVYERTWATTDFSLQPANATLDGRPFNRIAITPNGRYTFPKLLNGLKITGKFGWSAVPTKVKQACMIEAARLYERKNSPFGVIAVVENRIATVKDELDPDAQVLLQGLVRYA